MRVVRAGLRPGLGVPPHPGLPGGGVALVRAASQLENQPGEIDGYAIGRSIIKRACSAPLSQIVSNAGGEPVIIAAKIAELEGNQGYDAANDEFGDMIIAGIIDPVKVTRCALKNAASVAGLMLTVDASIVEDTNED